MTGLNITQAREALQTKLDADIALLPAGQKLRPVEKIKSIARFQLNHPKAQIGLIYKGEKRTDKTGENAVVQDRFILFDAVLIARESADDDDKTPEEWIDFISDSVSGIVADGQMPHLQVTVDGVRFIKQDEWEWWYSVSIKVPTMFFEVDYRN